MGTLGEIIELVKSGGRPEYDEMRFAIVAMSSLSAFDASAFGKLYTAEKENRSRILTSSAVYQAEEHIRRWRAALGTDPKVWLGPDHDPDNPECQRFRKIALKTWEKAEKGELPNQKKGGA